MYQGILYSPPTSETALKQSDCNKVGYFKAQNRFQKESCLAIQQNRKDWIIPYNRAFHRNCDGMPIERWAWRNGTHICNIIMDGCLSFTREKNYIYLHLAKYNSSTTSQQWKIDKFGEIINADEMCPYAESPFLMGNEYVETPMLLGAKRDRVCISWSFVPILDDNNNPICADFKVSKTYSPAKSNNYYYNFPLKKI